VMTLKRILVATDFSGASLVALEQARALAVTFNAQLHLMHVVAEPLHETWVGYTPGAEFAELMERLEAEARARLAGAVAQADIANGRTVLVAVWGDPADEILKYADRHDVDLIVCGTHGRRGWSHLMMGSVAERIVRLARCPVLTVHAHADRTRAAA